MKAIKVLAIAFALLALTAAPLYARCCGGCYGGYYASPTYGSCCGGYSSYYGGYYSGYGSCCGGYGYYSPYYSSGYWPGAYSTGYGSYDYWPGGYTTGWWGGW